MVLLKLCLKSNVTFCQNCGSDTGVLSRNFVENLSFGTFLDKLLREECIPSENTRFCQKCRSGKGGFPEILAKNSPFLDKKHQERSVYLV